jgi:hypothetical protein
MPVPGVSAQALLRLGIATSVGGFALAALGRHTDMAASEQMRVYSSA